MQTETHSKTRIDVVADDFGMHSAVDEAVVLLASRGRLSGTGCLVDGPSFADGAGSLLASGLQCGLHLNFTESFGARGVFMPLGQLLRACWARRLDPASIQRQIASQLDRYEAVMGQAPQYVDGHQHVHQFPQIREMLFAELERRYPAGLPRPWLRSTLAGRQTGVPVGLRFKAHSIAALGGRRHVRLACRHGFETNRRLLGVYDFRGGAQTYEGLLQCWLEGARAGDLIMCHPAVQSVPGDPLGAQRQAEFEVWASDATGALLERLGVQISRPEGCRPRGPVPAA